MITLSFQPSIVDPRLWGPLASETLEFSLCLSHNFIQRLRTRNSWNLLCDCSRISPNMVVGCAWKREVRLTFGPVIVPTCSQRNWPFLRQPYLASCSALISSLKLLHTSWLGKNQSKIVRCLLRSHQKTFGTRICRQFPWCFPESAPSKVSRMF